MNLAAHQQLRLDPSPYEREAQQYAERIYRTLVALEPLYNVPEAIQWLLSKQVTLQDEVPAELLALHSGTARVEEKLSLILDGAFS